MWMNVAVDMLAVTTRRVSIFPAATIADADKASQEIRSLSVFLWVLKFVIIQLRVNVTRMFLAHQGKLIALRRVH